MKRGLAAVLKAYPEVAIEEQPHQTVLSVPAADLIGVAGALKDKVNADLESLTASDWPEEGEIESVAHLVAWPDSVLVLKTRIPRRKAKVPSLSSLWSTADWQEREAAECFGIEYEGHPDLRRLLLEEGLVGSPFRKDFEPDDSWRWSDGRPGDAAEAEAEAAQAAAGAGASLATAVMEGAESALEAAVQAAGEAGETDESGEEFPGEAAFTTQSLTLNVGPQHPSTHGVLHVIVKLQGERIVEADASIGYLHRGIEKLSEDRPYRAIVPLADRMDYLSPFANEQVLIMAIEKAAGIEVPPRAEYVRTLMAEIGRIASHLIWLGTFGLDLGAFGPFFYCFREREACLDLFEMIGGSRMFCNYLRPGGLRDDMPDGFLEKTLAFVDDFPRRMDDYEDLLTENAIFTHRTQGINPVRSEQAVDWGWTGPLLRSTGLKRDLRRDAPYSAYTDIDFDVPVGATGDVFDRYTVRVAEMRESAKMVRQLIEKMPDGEFRVRVPKVIKPPEGEIYARVEGPRGVLGCYLVANGTDRPYRLHFRPPAFINLSAIGRAIVGWKVADAVAILGSLDIVLGEVDR